MTARVFWDVAVLGAGAAGLMAAVTARHDGLNVLMLDGKEKIGAKILISGGTRCNLTNQEVTDRDFQGEERNIFRSVLKAFSASEAVRFFEGLGVSVVLEEGGKYFPSTHSGRTVLEAFLKEVRKIGICLESPRKVQNVFWKGSSFQILGEGFAYEAKTVILATGGLSYPATGSDGSGYAIARSFGHRLMPTIPSLTPLETDDPQWKSLSGISLPVRLSLYSEKKKAAEYEGPMLFTHFGFSGPVVLNVSRHWIRLQDRPSTVLRASFLPAESPEKFKDQLMLDIQKAPSKSLKNFLMAQNLPERFVEILMKKQGLDFSLKLNSLKKEKRESLASFLFQYPLEISGAIGYSKAEVTAGGVDLAQIHRQSLESRLRPGLFFAGEIMDVDGRIGGFNFQWAWSSGVAAGRGVIQKLKPPDCTPVVSTVII